MAVRRPLTRVGGKLKQLPDGDVLTGAATPTQGALADSALQPSDTRTMPFINVMPDAGRFGGGSINPLSVYLPTAYAASTFFNNWNGATFATGGKFYYDNTNNGGVAGTNNSRVAALMTAMGRGADRYGVEFHLLYSSSGTGTAVPGLGQDGATRYLCNVNGSKALFAAGGGGTAVFWFRAESGSFQIGNTAQAATGVLDVYINGVAVPAGTVITTAMGWIHIRVSGVRFTGYDNAFPYIYGTVTSNWAAALAGFYSGLVDVGIHTSPLLAINSTSA